MKRGKNAINDLISADENSCCIFNGLATPIIIYLGMQFIRRHNVSSIWIKTGKK